MACTSSTARATRIAQDAFELFPGLGVENDGAHAFYLGAELMKAEIAWRLGKRYAQDEPLAWGAAAPGKQQDRLRLAEAGHTLKAKKDRTRCLHQGNHRHDSR